MYRIFRIKPEPLKPDLAKLCTFIPLILSILLLLFILNILTIPVPEKRSGP
jgi:hypothetical protein